MCLFSMCVMPIGWRNYFPLFVDSDIISDKPLMDVIQYYDTCLMGVIQYYDTCLIVIIIIIIMKISIARYLQLQLGYNH